MHGLKVPPSRGSHSGAGIPDFLIQNAPQSRLEAVSIAFARLPRVYKSEWRERVAAIYLGYDFLRRASLLNHNRFEANDR